MEPNNFNSEQNSQPASTASVEMDAALNAASQPQPESQPEPSTMQAPAQKKKTNWMMILVILFAVLAAGGIGFGAWAWMDGSSQVKDLNDQVSSLKKQNSELLEQVNNLGEQDNETDGGGETDTSVVTKPEVNTEDYIYVGEWGVKFKIPDNLSIESYRLGFFDDGEWVGASLCVSGATTGHGDAEPTFLGGILGCLTRNTKSVEGGGLGSGMAVGEYYWQGPQAVQGDGSDTDWEVESVNAIKEMLSTSNMSDI